MCISREGLQKKYFSDEQKQKDPEAAAHFHINATKIALVIIILMKFVREDLISVISFLLNRHSIFICSITGFRAIDYPPRPPTPPHPLLPTRHFHILCKICEHIYRQKLLLAQGRGPGGGGEAGAICHKTFPNFYMFHCKKHSIWENLFHKCWFQGNLSAKTVIFDEALFFSKTIGVHTPSTVRAPCVHLRCDNTIWVSASLSWLEIIKDKH